MNAVKKIAIPNLVLISGNGRNSGKTLFARSLISHFSKKQKITGIKISPHFHDVNQKTVLVKNNQFIICEEQEINSKDSSLMLQAGASKVLFMMVNQNFLGKAFNSIKAFLPESLIICESGGLHEVVTPGIHFFIKEENAALVKPNSQGMNPVIVKRNGISFDFDLHNIQFKNNKAELKNGTI